MTPSDEIVDRLAKATLYTLKNAIALCEEARLLFEAGFHARAFALAALCLEEIAKQSLLMPSQLYEDEIDEQVWRWEGRSRFVDHQSKLVRGRVLAGSIIYAGQPDQFLGAVFGHLPAVNRLRETQRRKLKALYVHYQDGTPSLPQEEISREEAESLLQEAEVLCGQRIPFAYTPLQTLRDFLKDAREFVRSRGVKTYGDLEALVKTVPQLAQFAREFQAYIAARWSVDQDGLKQRAAC